MKYLLSTLYSLVLLSAVTAETWITEYDELLQKYVSSKGVKYKKLKKKEADLHAITTQIAKSSPKGTKEEQLAFYINAYNAWMLKKALDAYPVSSLLKADPDVYKRNDITVAHETTSLDRLENDIIRKQFSEPRIHFALNCASVGCPPLRSKAYRGSTLNEDLHKVTSNFINSSQGVVANSTNNLIINEIFKWYAKDFVKAAGSVGAYIAHYKVNVSPSASISYLPYSWALNKH